MKINTPDKYSDSGDQPRLGNWRPKTRDPRHIVLSYRGTEEQIASYDEQTAARTDIQKLQIPAELSNDEVRTWAFVCLLNSPFAHAVIQLLGEPDKTVSYRILSGAYGLRLTEARRDMETVQNWLAFLLRSSSAPIDNQTVAHPSNEFSTATTSKPTNPAASSTTPTSGSKKPATTSSP